LSFTIIDCFTIYTGISRWTCALICITNNIATISKEKKIFSKSTFGITNLTLHHFYMVTTNRLKKSVK